ncbi:MAG: DNA-processing protein DprA, partial [Alphaproteobacteria bacterium]
MEAEPALSLSDDQRLAWLRLIRSDNVGPITFRDLLDRFGSATAALDALPDLARRAGRRIRICSIEHAEREVEAIAAMGARLIAIGEPGYPPWLARIDSAPPVITIRGDVTILSKPMIAIVGSRNASVSGRKMAANIASALGRAGLVVASGLARGIDAAAHEAALLSGTVAVFAGGLDRIYPAQNVPLAERIVAEGGVQMSETQLGLDPRARDFPRRNRIVSGLSLGVVIIEAAERSGSLITARLAGEQGRTVFAVPGSPLDPRAAGTNRLLKEGAALV